MEWSRPDEAVPAIMIRNPVFALSLVVLVAAVVLAGASSAQSLYRYVDENGRVVYSDQPPPPNAKQVEPKQLPENVIETDAVPLQARQAAEHFPVTLYTFDCDVCRDAQALLARRGVPFQTVIVTEEKGAARLKALTGKQAAPVLQVGDKQVLEGYNEQRWQATLDDAGYPRTASTARRAPPRTPAPADAAAKATPPAASDAAPPAPGQGYPK
jgi:glutaredoxin